MKRNVYCLGEAVLDVTVKSETQAVLNPGGSMLNSAVSLARAGHTVHFIGELAKDIAGSLIRAFLAKNNVCLTNTNMLSTATPLAISKLDEHGNAQYDFYKQDLESDAQTCEINFHYGDVLLFGSSYATSPLHRKKVLSVVQSARKAGAIIIYDPNFRPALVPKLPALSNMIYENISMADIVRATDDDIRLMFELAEIDAIYQMISKLGCENLILSAGANPLQIKTPQYQHQIDIPQMKTVSTIGAGDAFNAGLIASLVEQNIQGADLALLELDNWIALAANGIKFARAVCGADENYIPVND